MGILGGGLSGLTLGYLLKQRGVTFEILERESECGGLMRTTVEDGFTFDYGGSHIIFSQDKQAIDFLLTLLGDNKVVNRRNSKVLYNGKYIKYPFENGLASLPKDENFECLNSFIQNLINKEQGKSKYPVNLKEWCYYTFGKGIAEKYLIPYNEKIWKYPTEKTGLRWVERIPNPPVEDIIKSSLGIETEGYLHQLDFYYPLLGGIQSIINSLKQFVEPQLTLEFDVKKVFKEANQWIVADGQNERRYDKLISTIPLQYLLKAMANVPPDVQNAVNDLKYNSIITVMIGLNISKMNDQSWLYIPEADSLAHRISFPSNYSPYVAPKNNSSILAEVTCPYGGDLWSMTDESIITQVISDLDSHKLIDKESICFTKAMRSEFAYVIDDLEHSRNISIIRDYANQIGIDLIGRFSEFEYLNMDACIRSAMNYINSTENTSNKTTIT